MSKKEMLERLISYYTDGNKARFAAMIGVKPQTVSAWLARDTFDVEVIYANCKGVSGDWLLSGQGEMIRKNNPAGDDGRLASEIAYLERILAEKERTIMILMDQQKKGSKLSDAV